jgi:hypothetical protein
MPQALANVMYAHHSQAPSRTPIYARVLTPLKGVSSGMTVNSSDPRWMTQQQVADRLAVPISTLRDWRQHRHGPPATKLGRGKRGSIRYWLPDVEAWEREQKQPARSVS